VSEEHASTAGHLRVVASADVDQGAPADRQSLPEADPALMTGDGQTDDRSSMPADRFAADRLPVESNPPSDSAIDRSASGERRLTANDRRLTTIPRLAQVKDELVAWVKTLMSAAVYAVLIVTFLFQVARVEGQSMAPTLEDQDRLIVNKLAYRIGEPRRGDIVMLYYPLNPEKSFVKRVIAEEGDTVRIVDGRVYVNDIPLKDDYVASEYRSHDDWGPQLIPEGYDFVMGDHRNNSSDSRHWGNVPKKYIIGKVQLRWWPVPSARLF
jgi:signal peptidase I